MSDDSQTPNSRSAREPSVLDYVKSRLSFGRSGKVEIPALQSQGQQQEPIRPPAGQRRPATPLPWVSLCALGLALFAQRTFEPPNPSAFIGIAFYIVSFGLLLLAALRREWVLTPLPETSTARDPLTARRVAFIISLPFTLLAYLFFSGNLFTVFNLALWLVALGCFVWSLWLSSPEAPAPWQRLRLFFARERWQINISRWTLLLFAATALVLFFRVYHLQQTPNEPFSDHAEKLLDVYDVTQGQTHIFFPRNTGREAIQMYWTVLISWIFGSGLSFLSLKIGTVLFGLFTLPYIYLLGREIASPRAGLLAFTFAGIGYWPNLISRIGLRFPLYPLFVAPTLLYLIRGLRTRNRNDFILSGIFLGLGLHGYSPFRIVPLLVALAFLLYVVHAQSKGARRDALLWLVILGFSALLVFLPLLRYASERPDLFSYRALSRMGAIEQPLPGPWYAIFLSNTWNALRLFNWDNGNIWVNSVADRPALDVVSGALFLIGLTLVLVRYVKTRHWLDLFLVLSIPALLLPSILSLAYPQENPALNRTAGALVPAFLLVAMALDGLLTAFGSGRQHWALALTLVLLFWSASQNFDLVFRQFDQEYHNGSWNTSEMGAVIKEFGLAYGETDTVWIVPFQYWVDTRLPGVWAGIPNRDFAMWRDNLGGTLEQPGPKLFIVKANLQDPMTNDQATLDLLKQLYPQGSLSLHRSDLPGHDFWIYFVPAQ